MIHFLFAGIFDAVPNAPNVFGEKSSVCPAGMVAGEKEQRTFEIAKWQGGQFQRCKKTAIKTDTYGVFLIDCGGFIYKPHPSGGLRVKSKEGQFVWFTVHGKGFRENPQFMQGKTEVRSKFLSDSQQSIKETLEHTRYFNSDVNKYIQKAKVRQLVTPCKKFSF